MNQPEQSTNKLEILHGMLSWHEVQFASGAPRPSKYIPYSSVFHEYKRQHQRAILRLNNLINLIGEQTND